MRIDRRRAALALAFAAAGSLCSPAFAQDYPAKSITIVVPFAAGGPADALARALGERFQADLGRTVIIDNRPGATGNIGAQAVVRAPADGYTLLYTLDATLTANPELYGKRMGFDPEKDLTAVATIGRFDQLLAVNSKTGIKTMAQFVEASRKGLNYSSAGIGSPGHLTMEGLASYIHSNLNHVPYKGAAPATLALVSGEVDTSFIVTPALAQYVKDGRLTAMAVSGRKRSPLLPDVPTIAEAGYPGAAAEFSFVLMAPAGLPAPILATLSKETHKALGAPEVVAKLKQMDTAPVIDTPEQAAAELKKTRAHWAKVIKDRHFQAE